MTGCVGAALMAGVAAGTADDLESWAAKLVTVAREFSPDAAAADRFDGLHDVYRATYEALTDQLHRTRCGDECAL